MPPYKNSCGYLVDVIPNVIKLLSTYTFVAKSYSCSFNVEGAEQPGRMSSTGRDDINFEDTCTDSSIPISEVGRQDQLLVLALVAE